MKKLLFTCCAMLLHAGFVMSQTLQIEQINTPSLVGERMLTFDCPLNGINPEDVKVYVFYSDNRQELLTARHNPSGRATVRLKNNNRSKLSCTFYFPQEDHKAPNFITRDELNGNLNLSDDDKKEKYRIAHLLQNTNGDISLYGEFTDRNKKIINNPRKVYYKVTRVSRNRENSSVIHEFVMPRLFIVGYMGDSFASGEGAPHLNTNGLISGLPCQADVSWVNDFCHRSNNSGGMKAINKLISNHRELGIRAINTTCSGAIIEELYKYNQEHDNRDYVLPQMKQIENWCENKDRKTVDIVLFGCGGNNVGFADLMFHSILPASAFWEEIITETKRELDNLPERYRKLNSYFNEGTTLKIGKVLVMNYPDMLRGYNSDLCNGRNTSLTCGLNLTSGVYNDISELNNLYHSLNSKIAQAATTNDWKLIDIGNTNNHGICNCDEPYFNTVETSLCIQNDEKGSCHPNRDGYENLYKERVYNALKESIRPAQLSDLRESLRRDQERRIAISIARERQRRINEYRDSMRNEIRVIQAEKKYKIDPSYLQNINPKSIPLKTADEPKNNNENEDE